MTRSSGMQRLLGRLTQPRLLIAACLVLPAGFALIGCGRTNSDSAKETSGASTPGLFTVPADQLSHLQVLTVAPTTLKRVLRLTGAVAYNNFKTTPVISPVGGPVARILVTPGQKVHRGQPLLYVSSPDYSQLRSTYLKALTVYRAADKNYARANDLYSHHAIAEKDLLDAESTRNQSQADLQSAEQSLRILGVPKPDALERSPASAQIPVLAPIDGEVVEQLVAPGQLLQASTTQCFTISDMTDVWVLANVYEHDLAYVRVGDAVNIHTDAFPDVFQGKISFMAAALDPTSRTLQARIETRNPAEKLKKDMFVTATVEAGSIPNALTVPESAVLRTQENEPFVYVAAGQNQFAQRLVTLGSSAEGQDQVTDGLRPGDRVIGQGALFLQFANSLQQ